VPLSLEGKKAVVAEVSVVAREATAAVAAEYRGLTVAQMNDLRVKARDKGVYLRVVRNTLARRAVEGTEFECMKDGLVGPLLLAFAREEPSSAARVVRDFAKANDKLVVRLVAINGDLLPAERIDAVARLPTLDEARSTLLSVLKAPATKLVRTLAEPHAGLVRVLAARGEQQGEGATG
jgi:large subunit ribosomal protein L10